MKAIKKKDVVKKGVVKENKKRKKRSEGGGMDGVKTWLANNGEKLALAIFSLISLYIVYSGFRQEGLPTGNSPEDLNTEINRAKGNLEITNWDAILPTRYPEQDRFDQQATLDTEDVDASMYAMTLPLHPVLEKQEKIRKVPKILPPTEIEVNAGYGPIALKNPEKTITRESPAEGTRTLTGNLSRKYSNNSSNSLIKAVYFNCVKGIVPIKAQLDIYNEVFVDAVEFNATRDFPKYVAVLLRRRESGTENWKDINTIELSSQYNAEWQVNRDDPVANKYKHDESTGLVMELPTIVGRDLSKIVVHSKTKTKDEVDEEERLKDNRERSSEREGEGFFTERKTVRDTGDSSIDQGDQQLEKLKSDYLFFRVFDLDVEPGKVYEYQAQLLLEDPNNPRRGTPPSQLALDVSVIEQRRVDQENAIKNVLFSEWSETSPAVAVPIGGNVLTSTASAAKKIPRTSIPRDDPKAKVLAIAWDARASMEVPVEMDVTRGSFLNKKLQKAEAVDPRQQVIVELTDYLFATNTLIVDIAGGERLVSAGRDTVISPSMLLVMSPNGELNFQQEIENLDDYENNIIPPDPRQLEDEKMKKLQRDREDEEGKGEGGNRRRTSGRRGGRNNSRDRDREE